MNVPRPPVARRAAYVALAVLICVVVAAMTSVAPAVPPEIRVDRKGLHIPGVDAASPIVYDNDWWSDVFDNNYLWAQAHLGRADLRANVVTRDMWDHPNYKYPMARCMEDARQALDLARQSGLRNLPDLTTGSDRVLDPPQSRNIDDTTVHPTPGSRLIVAEARKASPEKPLVVVAGGPLTTVANALLEDPSIGPRLVVFALAVSSYGYNGKDGWSVYVVAKRTRLVEWATRAFWKKNEVFAPRDFQRLPRNPFFDDMRRLIQSNLGQVNQLGDGAPLVWLFDNRCWTGAVNRRAVFDGRATNFPEGQPADVLSVPRKHTDFRRMRDAFFRVMSDPRLAKTTEDATR